MWADVLMLWAGATWANILMFGQGATEGDGGTGVEGAKELAVLLALRAIFARGPELIGKWSDGRTSE